MKSLVRAFFIFLAISCNNSNTGSDKEDKTRESMPDSLMHEVLQQHDVGMGKMNRIRDTKERIRHVLDSIAHLPADLQKKSALYRVQLDSMLNKLTFADRGMETWMNEFNMDSLKDNKEEQAKYLESEKTKISNVNHAMISALQKADSLLKNNN